MKIFPAGFLSRFPSRFPFPVRAALTGVAAAALGALALTPQAAGAAPSPARTSATATRQTAGQALTRLASARRALDTEAAIPGTAWVADPAAGRLVVTADPTVTGARMARLKRVTARLGDTVLVRRTTTRLSRLLAGGDAIWGEQARCSAAFNVVKDGQPYFLTAGHCGDAVPVWSQTRGGPPEARTADSVFPGHDYALARYTAPVDHPSAVRLSGGRLQKIDRAGQPRLGERVWRSGSTTGVHEGRITGLDATVNYPEGRVDGLIKTDICAEPGDSGGPLFDGDLALGITSGGSGNCVLGGETYYQPVTGALKAYGASILP
ncbi:S1 family peptidase [Streptomyces orinoci]|uniref:S1 family peptidase n=1 Tax=Streptomyces orinoci TaxID=67339 RepID=A0ABV3K551_STRON|nr:S1 family peptidase [Streptomyces orinoci]